MGENMPKVIYTAAKGLVQEGGSGITFETGPTTSVQAKVADGTISSPGVYTISGSAAVTLTMPVAADVPGGIFVFRAESVHAHAVTGSLETPGTTVFTNGTVNGSKVALSAVLGNSVSLISDGKNFCVLANSGSLTISGT
jgi:hypothetical protein